MINLTCITKTASYIRKAVKDKHMHPFISLYMGKEILVGTERLKLTEKNFKYPLLIFHGK